MTPRIEWSVKCDGCTIHRRYGAARLTAEREAVAHSMRYPDHVVHLTKTTIEHSFKRENTAVAQLPDVPPF